MNPASPSARLYIYGAGRAGREAWPGHDDRAGTFVTFPAESSVEEQVKQLVRDHSGTRVVVFAHSIGAVSAVLAAGTSYLDVARLILVEPALYDIARGTVAVERHISIVSDARALASTGDLRGFWAILRPLMFGGPSDTDRWDRERPAAERWARVNLPWGHGVRARQIRGIPTLVVTGGWNDEYEDIAAVLAAEGAEHRVLPGAGHRPQDLAAFPLLVDEFEKRMPHQSPDLPDTKAQK